MPVSNLSRIIATARPTFLILTPCCLALAVAPVIAEQITINYLHVLLIFVGALAAHISVNMLNEYQDFTSGLDFHTQRTPFSGGSGTLLANPELAQLVKISAIVCLLITVLIGIYFLTIRGWGIVPVGLVGILLVYFYTQKITHWPWLCLIAPGLAFGPLMINGAYFVLSGHYSAAVALSSLMVFFLVNNLLLLNQFPDVQADENAGRCNLPILIGRKKSAWVYIGFMVLAYTVLVFCISLSYLPLYSLLGLLSLFLAIPAGKMALQYANDIDNLKPALALNVVVTLSTPVLVAAGMVLQRLG
jgi:1,4-dihydroxy-2-naphthoate polyprenyltransferase